MHLTGNVLAKARDVCEATFAIRDVLPCSRAGSVGDAGAFRDHDFHVIFKQILDAADVLGIAVVDRDDRGTDIDRRRRLGRPPCWRPQFLPGPLQTVQGFKAG